MEEESSQSEVATLSPEEREHAEFNPSSLDMFQKCAGYRSRQGTNETAERGTRIHKALEIDDLDSLDEKEERPIAQQCKDFIDAMIADRQPVLPDHDLREVRVYIDLLNLHTFGTCDRLLIYGCSGIMIDFKTGYLEVADAEFNAQAWAYVIGAFQMYPDLDQIDFYFLIPNRDEISHHVFKRSDIPDMRLRLNLVIRRAMDGDDHPEWYKPQAELCEYCSRAATCSAVAKLALAVVGKSRPELIVPDSIDISRENLENVANLLRLAPIMETVAKGIRAAGLKLNLEQGVEIPGFRRIERSTPRGVTSVIGAWHAVEDKVPIDEFLAICGKISVVKLEDYFAAQAERGDKGKARVDLECRLRGADVLRDEGTSYYLRESKK
jgi:hypothetical protein